MVVISSELRTTLDALITQENELTATAQQRLGTYVDVAHDAISLINTFVAKVPSKHFLAVGSQLAVQKSATLAFLSYVRCHSVQGDFNLRQLIEFCSLTVYLIANPDVHFTTDQGEVLSRFDPPKKIMAEAYPWIKGAYPKLSSDLQGMKDLINDGTSHANVLTSQFLVDLDASDDDAFRGSFFDNLHPDFTRLNLLKLTYVILTVVDTIRLASQDHGGFEIAPDLDQRGVALDVRFKEHEAALRTNFPLRP